MGTPRYLKGKAPSLQFSKSVTRLASRGVQPKTISSLLAKLILSLDKESKHIRRNLRFTRTSSEFSTIMIVSSSYCKWVTPEGQGEKPQDEYGRTPRPSRGYRK